ncbi:MAG: hypothetical protein EOP84_04390 [Verrucomicrobiaceae bacterium]|nr:MAG: hypothetical protein EOP84_04390 [Verrucomicrobiaceae bacterium]
MRLERLPEYVTITLVTALGIAFAVFAGRYAGSGQIGLILMVLGAVAVLSVAVALRRSIWLFIPAAWILGGQIPIIPLPFAVKDIIIGFVFASYCVFVALKIVRTKPKITFLDLLLFANLLYLTITFLRNPVGVEALGSERVGGRPYFNVFMAVLAYLVLRRVTPTYRELAALPWLVTGMAYAIGVLNLVAYVVPWTAPILGGIYTGVSQDAYFKDSALGGGDSEKNRLNQLSDSGITATGLLCALYRPMTLLMPWFPGRFIVFTASMLAVVFSGHRSALLAVMIIFAIASYYRGRIRDAMHLGMAGGVMLFVLVLAQGRIIELPFAIQRTLSWMPGEWNHQAVADAQGSTEWRLEMWKIALKDSGYINDKLLGDGFGFTKWDLAVINQSEVARRLGLGNQLDYQESAMRVGNYHSGPITTLKFVGVVGSILYYALIFGIAVYAHRLILRARGTPYFFAALFIGIPLVHFPFTYIVVFGAFDAALPTTIFGLGVIQAFERGLDAIVKLEPPTTVSRKPVAIERQRPLVTRVLH